MDNYYDQKLNAPQTYPIRRKYGEDKPQTNKTTPVTLCDLVWAHDKMMSMDSNCTHISTVVLIDGVERKFNIIELKEGA